MFVSAPLAVAYAVLALCGAADTVWAVLALAGAMALAFPLAIGYFPVFWVAFAGFAAGCWLGRR